MWCQRHGPEVAPASASQTPAEEIRRIKRELAEARRANEILKAAFPLGRFGEPDDPARLIEFLVTQAGGWIVGQVIDSEGGFRRG